MGVSTYQHEGIKEGLGCSFWPWQAFGTGALSCLRCVSGSQPGTQQVLAQSSLNVATATTAHPAQG